MNFWGMYEEPDKIDEGLFISNYSAAKNKEALKKLAITHILSVCEITPPYPNEFHYLWIRIDDADQEDILKHFPPAIEFISKALAAGGKVLIHCAAGISRSSTMAIAYLMTTRKLEFLPAFQIVKKARACISPNSSFERQLYLWHDMKHSLEGDTIFHRRYRLIKLMSMREALAADPADYLYTDRPPTNEVKALSAELFTDHGVAVGKADAEVYSCVHCETKLFAKEHIVGHNRQVLRFGGAQASEDDCEEHIVEPLRWMTSSSGIHRTAPTSGSLQCPSCQTEVGQYSWWEEVCSCGAEMLPSFRITKTAVSSSKKETPTDNK